MFILVGICIWVLGFCKLEALGALMSSFEICSHIVAKWSCSSLCLFQWNWRVTCHRWKNNQWLSHWKWKRLLDGIKAHSIHDLHSYMWWGIYHIDLAKLSINTWVHFQCKTLSIDSQLIFILKRSNTNSTSDLTMTNVNMIVEILFQKKKKNVEPKIILW